MWFLQALVSWLGLHPALSQIQPFPHLDRHLVDSRLMYNFNGELEYLRVIDNVLVIRHVDGLIYGVGQNALNGSIGIIVNIDPIVLEDCFVLNAGFVELELLDHFHYLLGGVHTAYLAVVQQHCLLVGSLDLVWLLLALSLLLFKKVFSWLG